MPGEYSDDNDDDYGDDDDDDVDDDDFDSVDDDVALIMMINCQTRQHKCLGNIV